jgi:4-diphosphocytidyl-2-C-methyl-D-erythritol kinase
VIGPAPAKINLTLVVGPLRDDGKHEVLTVFQRVSLSDRIRVEPAQSTTVHGFPDDTLVRQALSALDGSRGWRVTIEKRIPVAAGLGGGSSDAATALRLANGQLAEPIGDERLRELASTIGADVPFFLADGPQIGSGDGTELEPVDLPQDFAVLLVVPQGARKTSTAVVYGAFDARAGAEGFEDRAAALRSALARVRRPRDLARLPANDLGSSPLAERLLKLGAFRADTTGAGPTVYGLFHNRALARAALRELRGAGRGWVVVPAWYG